MVLNRLWRKKKKWGIY